MADHEWKIAMQDHLNESQWHGVKKPISKGDSLYDTIYDILKNTKL